MFNPKLFNAGVVAVSVVIGVAIPSVSHAGPSKDGQGIASDASDLQGKPTRADLIRTTKKGVPATAEGRVIVGVRAGERAEAAESIEQTGADVVGYNPSGRFLVVQGPNEVRGWEADIESEGSVLYVEPDLIVTGEDIAPADPAWSSLWGMKRIGAPAAWETTTGSREVVVAVVDSGVDYTHEDLASSMWVNPGENPATPGDDDGNGWNNDIHGVDCANDDSDPMDDNSHGTHVAGTIGAAANNGVGVAGVDWNVRIMALKFLGANNWGYLSDAIQCMYYAIENGADLTNHSWSGTEYSQALYDVIAEARDNDQLLIAAAGNDSIDTDSAPSYPASFDLDNIISVGASDQADQLAFFSNRGQGSVDLAAPGVGVVSTVPGGYASYNGTSMAAPHVSGAAALLLATDPTLRNDAPRLRDVILSTVDQGPALSSVTATGGRLNVTSALDAVLGELQRRRLHVQALVGSATAQTTRSWKPRVDVTIADGKAKAAQGVKVAIGWSSGSTTTCITDAEGTCSTSGRKLKKKVVDVVASIHTATLEGWSFDPETEDLTSVVISSRG